MGLVGSFGLMTGVEEIGVGRSVDRAGLGLLRRGPGRAQAETHGEGLASASSKPSRSTVRPAQHKTLS